MRFLYASLFITLFTCQNTPSKKTVTPEKERGANNKNCGTAKAIYNKKS